MAQTINVRLNKGEAPSLGFRLQGGKDFGTPLLIQKVNIGSPAEKSGLLAGDSVIRINSTDVYNLRHKDAQDVIIRAGPSFEITVQRGGSTWKPAVIPTGSLSSPAPATVNSYSPVTKTSLAAKPQPSIGAIGTGHNLAAKPFAGQVNGAVNGAPKLVNKQYNSPVGLYSEQSIAETLSAQAEVLSTGVLGVNFKKNEKNYDASNSAVFRMVQEADKEPRDQEPEPDSGVVTAPIGVAGLRRVAAPETKPAPTTPQLPPGQNICAECERLIVGVFVRIKDKNLHIECFKCSTCGTSLKNVGYYNINSKLYCDVHAKLAARSNPAAANLAPVTVPPGNAPAGTISAALSTRPLPTSGLLAPLSPGSNVTAQPFQQQEIIDQVTQTELDCVTKQNDDDVVKLFKNVTLAASRRRDESGRSGETTFVSEKVITINNDYAPNTIKVSGPTPYSAYKVKTGTNVASPRPFSSVTSPLSPSINSYSSVPKPAPVSAPFSAPAPASDRGRSIQNIVWPPPAADESDFPTATPLYFPPPSQIRVPSPLNNPLPPAKSIQTNPSQRNFHPSQSNPPPQPTPRQSATAIKSTLVREHQQEDILNISKSAKPSRSVFVKELQKSREDELKIYPTDYSELEELRRITEAMDPKMSFCSSEVTSIIDRRSAVEHIETMADTQMLVESVLHQRPRSPPPGHKYVETETKPKVEVVTEPKENSASGRSSREPRIVTRVCVCTEPCCSEGKLCESCPLRHPPQLKRPIDIEKQQALKARIDKPVPRRYGSPQITGVSVTINNPGRIRESSTDSFAQIPAKKSSTALASALSVAPAEPFTPVSSASASQESIPLPEETRPYLPPERRVSTEPKTKPRTESAPKPDTAFVSALKIAPERPFTPVDGPAPVRKKKPKEDPVLKDLPKPMQWMSMVSALTTASERPYSPFVVESSSVQSVMTEEVAVRETTVKESQQEILRRSIPNDMAKPYTKPVIREKYDPVHDKPVEVQLPFPPISDELKASFEYRADYSQIKSEISSQIIEQAHLEQETFIEDSTGCSQQCPEQTQNFCQKTRNCAESVCAKEFAPKQENVIAKQTETTILKKPLEISSYLHKPEYLPQYQMSLNYDETIQLPHHKDIRKLLPSDQNKQRSANPKLEAPGRVPPQSVPPPSPVSQMPSITRPVATIQPDESNPRVHQMSFQPVTEDRPPKTTFSPRPGSLTPSMINKPPPTLPYYQANLVATQHLAPEVNLFDPKSPAISRSPSPCPEGRSSSPFPRQVPRAVSPAPGPPPNPLKAEKIPTFTKEDRMIAEAKKNITAYIPQYREIVDTVQEVRGGGDIEDNYQSYQISVPTQQISQQGTAQALRQERDLRSETICQRNQQGAQQVTTQAQQATAQVLKQEHRQSEENDQKQQIVKQEQCLQEHANEAVCINEHHEINGKPGHVETKPPSNAEFNQITLTIPIPQHFPNFAHSNPPLLVQSDRAFKADVSERFLPDVKNDPPPVPKTMPPQSAPGIHPPPPMPNNFNVSDFKDDPPPTPKTMPPQSIVPPPKMPDNFNFIHVKCDPPLLPKNLPSQSMVLPPTMPEDFNFIHVRNDLPPITKITPPQSIVPPPTIPENLNFVRVKSDPPPIQKIMPPQSVVLPPTKPENLKFIHVKDGPPTIPKIIPPQSIIPPPPMPNNLKLPLVGSKPDVTSVDERDDPFQIATENLPAPSNIFSGTNPSNGMDSSVSENNQTNSLKSHTNKASTTSVEENRKSAAAPVCCVCNNEIERGPFVTALGKIWCPEHFICATPSCRRQLADLGFVEEQGQLYCEYCFEQYLAPPCSKCNVKIKGDCLKAIGKNFHPECFNCSYCGKLFGNSPFFLEDGAPYCENDWNELFTTKCFACGFPVEAGDRWVEALSNNYHSQCFNCTMCKKNLEGQSFFAKGGRPFCKNHAR